MIVHHDFETRSRCDLKSCGQHRYAIDPSTEALMCAVSEAGSDKVWLWIAPGLPVPEKYRGHNPEAERLLAEATLLYAHSIPFEQAMHWGLHERGAPSPFKRPPPLETLRCTAAMARKAGLPSSLEQLGAALNLSIQKDNKGKALIRFFSLPNKEGNFNEPKDHLEKWEQFCDYCVTDVVTEKLGHKKLKPFELTGVALEAFQFDLRMNDRGVPANREALVKAQKIVEEVQSRVSEEFNRVTGLNPTQRGAVKDWLAQNGIDLPDMQAETLESIVGTSPAHRMVELYRKLSFAAVKKIPAMIDWSCPDGRMRGVFKYHGASTGRWTSGGPQIQNAKRPTADLEKVTEPAYLSILKGISADDLDLVYGEPLDVIASSIRHFIHLPGVEMLDGDYNAIEGRIACWVSGQDDILDCWRRGEDLYKRAVAFVYGIPESQVTKRQRNFGKVIELACQFQLGTDGFIRTCANFGFECDEALAEKSVHGYYRPTHDKIVKRWYYEDEMLRKAVQSPGIQCGPFQVRNIAGIQYLLSKLPSGRTLAYPHVKIESVTSKHGTRDTVTYFGQMKNTTKWGRISLYGGLSFQNRVQAIAADIMAHGAINAEANGMPPFALIHDQGLALRQNGKTAEDFAKALGKLPEWAKGLPVKVEAAVCPWYKK